MRLFSPSRAMRLDMSSNRERLGVVKAEFVARVAALRRTSPPLALRAYAAQRTRIRTAWRIKPANFRRESWKPK
jgi:hypothetical protein